MIFRDLMIREISNKWLNSKKMWEKWFLGNCPHGLWLAASGAQRLRG